MQSFMIGLLFRSAVMSFIGLLFLAITPILLKRYRAKWLYYSWLAILVGFILPFTFHISPTVINLSESAPLPSKELVPVTSSEITLVSESIDTISSLSLWQIIVMIWIFGIIVFLAVHLVKYFLFKNTMNRWGQTISEPSVLHLFEKVKQELKITNEITLKKCSCIPSPMLTGFAKKTIWLPNHPYKEEELNVILKHELVHLKRKDLWYKAFVLLITSIHWFNPLLYLFAKEIDHLCEYACDDKVMKNADIYDRKTYCQTILHTEKFQRTIFSTNFLKSTQILKKRIFSIMDMSKKKSGIVVMVLLMLFTTGGIAVSSAYAITTTPISYIDETFMKESILNGSSRGNFSTDYLIIDKKAVPAEPPINEKLYRQKYSGDFIATEKRYRYPIEIVHKYHGQKYTTVITIDYDFKLLAPIKYDELNSLIESYLLPFHELKSIPYEDFIKPNYLENRLKYYFQEIDKQNTDDRVEFDFYFSSLATNSDKIISHFSPQYIGTTPHDMEPAL